MSSGGQNVLYRIAKPCYQGAKRAYSGVRRRAVIATSLARMELMAGTSVSTSLRRRLWLWRHGFTTRTDTLLDLSEESLDEYLSEYQEGLTYQINGEWRRAMNNKLTAHLLLKPFEEHLPALYGVAADGEVRRYPAYEPIDQTAGLARPTDEVGFERHDAAPYLDSLLDDVGTVVLKPVFGAGGRGVHVISRGDAPDEFSVNDEPYSRAELVDLLAGLDRSLVVEYVEQSSFMNSLYSRSNNTVRLLTMWDDESDRPFVALSFVRVGTARSAPLDNLHQGGLLVGVDLDTGELTDVTGISDAVPPLEVERFEDHPSTGDRLVGRSIPNWDEITDGVLRMASGLPQLEYIGWDVLPTDDGFKVLEINSAPDVINPQMHSRFLRDPRVRRFYERHDVL